MHSGKRRNLFTDMRRAHDNIRWTSADALGSTWKSAGCSFVLWQIRSLSIVPRYADRLYTHTDEPTQSVLLAMHESFCINKASVLTASTSTTPKPLLAERQNISKALPKNCRIQNNQFQVKPNNLWNQLDSKFDPLREFGFDLTKKVTQFNSLCRMYYSFRSCARTFVDY